MYLFPLIKAHMYFRTLPSSVIHAMGTDTEWYRVSIASAAFFVVFFIFYSILLGVLKSILNSYPSPEYTQSTWWFLSVCPILLICPPRTPCTPVRAQFHPSRPIFFMSILFLFLFFFFFFPSLYGVSFSFQS
ncbi:hypothetical protein LZ32DRAFT_25154 [Colletotrichum eremochloae]|nr:hypothetical protein LZ32DRAFT_25154 [Colletotrichum eremochloae]